MLTYWLPLCVNRFAHTDGLLDVNIEKDKLQLWYAGLLIQSYEEIKNL